MKITDEMVERAAKAMWDSTERTLVARSTLDEAEPWEEATDMHVEFQEHARAALTAALGDVEPEPICEPLASYPVIFHVTECTEGEFIPSDDVLEDVVGETWAVHSIFPSEDGGWYAQVWDRRYEDDEVVYDGTWGGGTGPTIDAAIRAAVANARGGE